jgi:hypothetical protein
MHADLTNRSVHGRVVVVRAFSKNTLTDCHLLFIANGTSESVAQIVKEAQGIPLLLISEQPGEGMVNFFVENDQIRFEIDISRVNEAGLKMSSQLLKLAVVR